MKAGKILVLVGALLTLVSTFFFSFGRTNGADGRTFASGIGFLFNLPDIMGNVSYWEGFMGGETMVIYIVSIVLIVFLVSGVIQLVGLANKYVAIIGSLIVLGSSIAILLAITVDISGWGLNQYSALFWAPPLADGVWPLDVPIIGASGVFYQNLSLGTITLIAGGGLGLVGGILGVKD
ncbi:MAG: hypothetical protein ACXAEX_00455 [Promethearchaeota archaeon]|jgi:hypothetical protein